MERFKVWWRGAGRLRNIGNIHHRLMANFLRKRGWVVFYLEEEFRTCSNELCWLKLYLSDRPEVFSPCKIPQVLEM